MSVSSDFSWLNTSSEQAARRLLGCELMREIDGQIVRVKIVETEAYDQADAASHTFIGRTKCNDAMFKDAGHMYVYFTYGMHHCLNIVCGEEGYGSGVLIRAVEPVEGLNIIEERRQMIGVNVTNGPGKICAALAVNREMSGHNLAQAPIMLIKKPSLPNEDVTVTKRIGIKKAIDEPRRFYITENPYVSKSRGL